MDVHPPSHVMIGFDPSPSHLKTRYCDSNRLSWKPSHGSRIIRCASHRYHGAFSSSFSENQMVSELSFTVTSPRSSHRKIVDTEMRSCGPEVKITGTFIGNSTVEKRNVLQTTLFF